MPDPSLPDPALVATTGATLRLDDDARTAVARLDRLSSVAKIGAWELDLATMTLSFSPESYRITDLDPGAGLSLEQATAMVNPEARPAMNAALQAAIDQAAPFGLDLPVITLKGRALWVRVQAVAVVEHGQTMRLEGVFQDITERKQEEAAHRRGAETYSALLNTLQTGVVLTDEAGLIVDANPAAERILGLTRRETLERTFDAPSWAITRPDGSLMPVEEYASVRALREQRAVDHVEMGIVRPDGSVRWLLTSASPILVEGLGVCITFADITERKQAEAALARERTFLAEGQALAHLGSWEYSVESGETTWSEEEFRIYGLAPQAMSPSYAQLLERHVHPDDAARLAETFRLALTTLSPFDIENRIVRPDGSVRVVSNLAQPHLDAQGKLQKYTGSTLDVTERRATEDALRESEYRWKFAVEGANDGLWDWNVPAGTVFFSRRWKELLGFTDDELGNDFEEWRSRVHPDDLRQAQADLQAHLAGTTAVYVNEHRLRGKDGTWTWILSRGLIVSRDGSGAPLRVIGSHSDITARKRADAERAALAVELQQSRKLESIGQLAGGVAHEFNNMLGVILGYTELALGQVDPGQQLHADLEEIRVAATRSARVTRELLAFARKQLNVPGILDLNQTVADAVKMLGPLIGEHIQLTWTPAASLDPILADATQISQVLTNLCFNARDAIVGTGHVSVATEAVTIDAAYCAVHQDAVPGRYACLVVRDDGCGMTPETLAKAFEPFFTTKAVGVGTGLGLPSVQGIVLQHGGFVAVSSTPGVGTTFKLYFPAHVAVTRQVLPSAAADLAHGRGETVLVVEDEKALLTLIAKQLTRQGYTVLAASSPGEAIRLVREHVGTIHLLLADRVLPEMTGVDLAKRAVALRPQVRCLFMSGYDADVVGTGEGGVLAADERLLRKPFTAGALAASVRQALDAELH